VVRYKGASAGTGGTITTGTSSAAGYTLHTFTNTGTSALDLSGLNLSTRLGAVENGVISGNGSLTFNGPGTLTLGGANSYTGGTTINSGSLLTSTANRLADSGGVTVASGAIFQLGGNETIASLSGAGQVKVGTATLTTGASHSTFSGTLYGSGDLVKVGGGIFTLSGNNGLSTFTGNAIINDGTLVLASANALNAGTVLTMNGGTLTVNQRTIIGALEQGTGVVNGTGELVSALTLTSSGALNSILADGVDYAAGILKRSEEMTTVGAANTFTGKIIVQGGTLRLVEGGSFDADSSLNMSAGGTMDLNNKSQSFSAVNGTGGTVALGNGTLGVDGSSDSNFAGSITGNGSLTKDGSGTLALTGNSSYTGATVVSDGLLVVNGNISTSTMTTIQNGATLGGSGSVGALTVESGGTVTPGNSPGILLTGDYSQAGTLSLDLDGTLAGVEYDQVNVSGTVNLSGQLTATVGYSPVNDQMLFILINDGSDAIVGNFSGMAHMDTILLDGYQWQISYTANYTGSNTGTFTGGNDIALKAVPEPSALVLFGLSTLGLVARRRRTT
jgi:autotransporter-associated beta strand protein